MKTDTPTRRWRARPHAAVVAALVIGPILFSSACGAASGAPGGQGVTNAVAPGAAGRLVEVSSDPFVNTSGQYANETEPDTVAYGPTLISAFMQGGPAGGDIGFARSANGGRTWTHGTLPITTFAGGSYATTADPTVAYDAREHAWLISAIAGPALDAETAVVVTRSTDDGRTWSAPVVVGGSATAKPDKDWITCDTHRARPYYGNCYAEWDIPASGFVRFSTSADGGRTWSAAQGTAGNISGTDGQPLVRPDGTVVVPLETSIDTSGTTSILLVESRDGGRSWGPARQITQGRTAADPGGLVSALTISAAQDASGKLYVVWKDCRFRPGCSANDIVMTTSADGIRWSPVRRVTGGSADDTLPGIGVDPASSGSSARMGIFYYSFPAPACTGSSCQIDARYISSADGGATWSAPVQTGGPMSPAWLVKGNDGSIHLGDYFGPAVMPRGNMVVVFPLALTPPSGTTLHENMYAVPGGLPIGRVGRL